MKDAFCTMSSSSWNSVKPSDIFSVLLNNEFAKSVTVPEAKQHQDGHTIYKIILQAIRNKKTIEEDPLAYVAWKRFRDLHKLHRRIAIVHVQLYLKGTVPSFPKPDFFGRLEPSVVEERRQAAQHFLSFVVQNPVLCQCEALLAFFSGAEFQTPFGEKPITSDFDNIPSSSSQAVPLSPILAVAPLHIPLAQESARSLSECSDMSEDLSFPSPTEPKTVPSENTGDSNDLLAAFDPFPLSSSSPAGSNFRMLSEALEDLQVSSSVPGNVQSDSVVSNAHFDLRLSPPLERSVSPPSLGNHIRIMTSSVSSSPLTGARARKDSNSNTTTKWRSRIADFFPRMSPASSKQTVHAGYDEPPFPSVMKTSNEVKNKRGGSPTAPTGVARRRSSLDYVLQAAEFISSAQKAEEEGAFDLAFTCYKSAVMLLLQGVQDEKDLHRRNVVRLKTAKYLKKAEKLYSTYIAVDTNSSFCLDGFTSRFLSNIGIMGFQSVYSELSQYRVLRVLGRKVQLVQDVTSGEKYVVKFLDKSCYSSSYAASKILDQCVPIRVPHMVKLIKFWDTETSAILLLEYAAGGLLWRRLRSYLDKTRRMFQRYYENKTSGDDKDKRHARRSGSADSMPAMIRSRSVISHRHRSGSDPHDRQSGAERCVSVTSDPLEDEGVDEFVESLPSDDTSLFGIYEQRSMQTRYSTDSFGLDTAPSSAAPTANRRFSLLYADNHVANDTSDEQEELLLRKWIAQITVALGALHSEGVLCKDMHPDNLLLDSQDNLLLTFFCDWNGVDRSFDHRLSSALYSAPEVDGTINEPLTDAADWWSLGVIVYEIATGVPLHTQCPHGISPNTVIPLPDYLSVELRDLITRLIRYDAEDRLGACFGGVDEIKMHPFFMEFDWHTVESS